MLQQIRSTQKHKDVSQVVFMAAPPTGSIAKKIILNPPYQRNVVWTVEQKSGFIDSILKGINSHHLIFNVDENNDHICMDGKQRITSLLEFSQNKFHVNIDGINYYFDKVPANKKNDKDFMVLPNKDRDNFIGFPISIDEYVNLTYEQQVDIFNRIQKGQTLSKGELVAAQFITDNVTINFNNYCNKNQDLFTKFFDVDRKEHCLLIMKIMYMISKNVIRQPTPSQAESYIKSITTVAKFNAEIAKVDKLIELCFGDSVLGHISITSKLSTGFIIMICMGLYKIINGQYNKIDKNIILSAVRKIYKEIKNVEFNEDKIKLSNNTIENTEKLIIKLKKYYDDLNKGTIELSEDDEEVKESTSESTESEEIIIPTKKIAKKKAVKTKKAIK